MLGINPEKVCFIVVKAHEFDVKVPAVESDPGSNRADEDVIEVLAEHADDPTYQELKEFLDALNEDEMVNLLALAWLGRGEYTSEDWESVLAEAREIRNEHAADYLLGMPLLSDYLEEGLSLLDYSLEDFELGRL